MSWYDLFIECWAVSGMSCSCYYFCRGDDGFISKKWGEEIISRRFQEFRLIFSIWSPARCARRANGGGSIIQHCISAQLRRSYRGFFFKHAQFAPWFWLIHHRGHQLTGINHRQRHGNVPATSSSPRRKGELGPHWPTLKMAPRLTGVKLVRTGDWGVKEKRG